MSDFVEMEFEWLTKTCIRPFERQPHKMTKHTQKQFVGKSLGIAWV